MKARISQYLYGIDTWTIQKGEKILTLLMVWDDADEFFFDIYNSDYIAKISFPWFDSNSAIVTFFLTTKLWFKSILSIVILKKGYKRNSNFVVIP